MDNNQDERQTTKLQQPDLKIPVSGTQDAYQQHSQLIKTELNYPQPIISKSQEESLIRYNHVTYLLYVLSYFTAGLLWIVPIIMNYARRDRAEHTWLATHFDWQIKTFWYSIIFGLIGIVMAVIGLGGLGLGVFADSSNVAIGSTGLAALGGLVFLFAFIWHIYRIVKGWIALTDKRPVP
ncbi:DUF4870 family protein [Psychrobacter phenylpyruvicus]|uniref:Predicted membrane protein n=1 Tax=Psychrobacter phenylpyruvicus TaxID=29432 RepID=A0A379LKG0_9GAMM|nr:hypothetical protein [Psychrobacter phenylpyruvicus]SUD91100.1 Predicted membrane protein [Psychrobacter phenylpyruvicus]